MHHETLQEEVAITGLKSMDEMVDYLVELETSLHSKTSEVDNPAAELAHLKFINLGKWLNNIYEEPDWEPAVRNLSTIARKKKIQLAGYIFEMQLFVSHTSDEAIFVIVTVQCENVSLPVGMQVNVPDESGTYTETVTTPGSHIIRIPMEFSFLTSL